MAKTLGFCVTTSAQGFSLQIAKWPTRNCFSSRGSFVSCRNSCSTARADGNSSVLRFADLNSRVLEGNQDFRASAQIALESGSVGETDSLSQHVEKAWEHWNKLGAPKLIVAPMMDQSELPFRMLCRKYGATGAYSQMFHSRPFAFQAGYRKVEFSTCPVSVASALYLWTFVLSEKHKKNSALGVLVWNHHRLQVCDFMVLDSLFLWLSDPFCTLIAY